MGKVKERIIAIQEAAERALNPKNFKGFRNYEKYEKVICIKDAENGEFTEGTEYKILEVDFDVRDREDFKNLGLNYLIMHLVLDDNENLRELSSLDLDSFIYVDKEVECA